jgi:hypothetical protein
MYKYEKNKSHLPKTSLVFSTDFDDTLVEKVGLFDGRLKMFSALSKASNLFIVTAREHLIFEDERLLSDNILKFCDHHNIDIAGVYYNVKDKVNVLKDVIKTQCHFEDDVRTVLRCIEENVPVMCPGEIFNKKYIDEWCNVIDTLNETRFYRGCILEQKKRISEYVTDKIFGGVID